MVSKDGTKQVIQNNTLLMYEWLRPWVDGVIFAEHNDFHKEVEDKGLEYRNVEVNKFNMPIFRKMYIELEDMKPQFFGYHNGDILFNYQLLDTLQALRSFIELGVLRKEVVMVGRRSNFNSKLP
eukprot:UN23479